MWSRDREGLDQVRIALARARGGWIVAGLLGLTSGIVASARRAAGGWADGVPRRMCRVPRIQAARRRSWTGAHRCQLQQRVGQPQRG